MLRATLLAMLIAAAANAADPVGVYELRVYYAAPGKLDALHARFRDHTLKLFEKHGITNVGYWVPIDNKDDRLIYLVGHKDRDAAKASWKAFGADPAWQTAYKASETNGKLVAKLDSFYLSPTDFSPPAADSKKGANRAFELRTYVASGENLPALLSRFRDHTTKLFAKHGMTNVAYTTLDKDDKATVGKLVTALSAAGDDKVDGDTKASAKPVALVYLMAHESPTARNKSFDAFRADPTWVAAKSASEAKAGGPLTVKDGVKSLMMKATDYSPMK